jgi:hypothetical protein
LGGRRRRRLGGRIVAVLLKEVMQLRRDRLTFAMLVGVPILQLVLFGYAINGDPRLLPTAVVAHGRRPAGARRGARGGEHRLLPRRRPHHGQPKPKP